MKFLSLKSWGLPFFPFTFPIHLSFQFTVSDESFSSFNQWKGRVVSGCVWFSQKLSELAMAVYKAALSASSNQEEKDRLDKMNKSEETSGAITIVERGETKKKRTRSSSDRLSVINSTSILIDFIRKIKSDRTLTIETFISQGIPLSNGSIQWNDLLFEGDWTKKEFHGKGTFSKITANQEKIIFLEGTFDHNRFTSGTFRENNEGTDIVFTGKFENGFRNGVAVISGPKDLNVQIEYIGQIMNGVAHGTGTLVERKNGSETTIIHFGQWKDGVFLNDL